MFKNKFEEAKHIVATECDLYNGKGDKENEHDESSEEDEDDADVSKDKIKSNECAEVTQKISELKVASDEAK